MATEILELVGQHVRSARAARHWTIRELAERSGVSVRFLVQLEAGRGNISVKRLADLARAFKIPTAELLKDDYPDAPRVVALLGLRGAGKTTIGKQLARRLRVRFVELDRQIEKAADMSLARSSRSTERTTTGGWSATRSRHSWPRSGRPQSGQWCSPPAEGSSNPPTRIRC